MITLLGNLGVKIQKNGPGDYTFQADEVNVNYLKTEAFKKEGGSLRGSIMIVGPLLARFGCGYIPKPGGDKIGRRRLDTHFEGFINLGAKYHQFFAVRFAIEKAKEAIQPKADKRIGVIWHTQGSGKS